MRFDRCLTIIQCRFLVKSEFNSAVDFEKSQFTSPEWTTDTEDDAGSDCGRPFGGDGYVHTLVSAEHRQWDYIAGLPDDAFEQLLVGTFQILLNQLSEEELLGCRLHANCVTEWTDGSQINCRESMLSMPSEPSPA